MRLFLLALAAPLCIAIAHAQTLYRWTDEKGKVQITDTPPPASAKGVQKSQSAVTAAPAEQVPFATSLAMQDFPVTLYTFVDCEQLCTRAREAMNKRGVPFKEVQISTREGVDELKAISGSSEAPTLFVGRSVQKGFDQGAYDALLDAARYPKAGAVPVRNQQKPPKPADETAAVEAPPVQEAPAQPAGPYAPRPGKEEPRIARPYAPIPGKDEPRTGPYAPKPAAGEAARK